MATKLETLEELEEHLMLVLNQIEWLEAERMQYEQAICDMCPHDHIHEGTWYEGQIRQGWDADWRYYDPEKRFRVCKRCGLAEIEPFVLFARELVPVIARSEALRRVRIMTTKSPR